MLAAGLRLAPFRPPRCCTSHSWHADSPITVCSHDRCSSRDAPESSSASDSCSTVSFAISCPPPLTSCGLPLGMSRTASFGGVSQSSGCCGLSGGSGVLTGEPSSDWQSLAGPSEGGAREEVSLRAKAPFPPFALAFFLAFLRCLLACDRSSASSNCCSSSACSGDE